jgi:hypothetical protein
LITRAAATGGLRRGRLLFGGRRRSLRRKTRSAEAEQEEPRSPGHSCERAWTARQRGFDRLICALKEGGGLAASHFPTVYANACSMILPTGRRLTDTMNWSPSSSATNAAPGRAQSSPAPDGRRCTRSLLVRMPLPPQKQVVGKQPSTVAWTCRSRA